MTDKELLTFAAKAAGMNLQHAPEDGPFKGCQFIDGKSAAWNPLTNDGDAMRLAVKLGCDLVGGAPGRAEVYCQGVRVTEYLASDPYSATRRAIVRAAAEIGKETK